MPEIISLGELLVEIMRPQRNIPHGKEGETYKGPFPSGAPAIFIDSVARISQPFKFTTGILGVVGNDEFGQTIITKLKNDGVDTSKIRVDGSKTTGIAFNQYNSDGSRKFIFATGAAGETSPIDIEEDYFSDIKALHIMGSSLSISKSSREACYKAIEIARKMNPDVIVSFDPNLRTEMLDLNSSIQISKPVLESTSILLPSGEEAEMLTEIKNPEKACKNLLNQGIKIVALKEGRRGCTIYASGLPDGIKLPGFKVNEIDPTGAGDSFGGAFIAGYLAGLDLKSVGKLANAVGALKVSNFGPIPNTSYKDAIKLIEEQQSP
jgi:sugar/nucleoside kinase (ribokinase family)